MEVVDDKATTSSTSDSTATATLLSNYNSSDITSPSPSVPVPKLPTTRSSARVRAAKEKEKSSVEGSVSKGKGKAVSTQEEGGRSLRKRRKTEPVAVTSAGVVISEPRSDPKGKKRALPEAESPQEHISSTPPKRLRSSSKHTSTSKADFRMPKKSRSSLKGKGTSGSKIKSNSSAVEDVDMRDANYESDGEREIEMDISETVDNEEVDDNKNGDGGEDDGEGEAGHTAEFLGADEAGRPDSPSAHDEEARSLFGLLGGDFTQLGAFLSNISSRLKSLLTNIKQRNDPTVRVIALQELSELLSVSNEDSLHSFSVDAFVAELVKIMGGNGKVVDDDSDIDPSDDERPKDSDAALAAALAAADEEVLEDIPEAQLLACRCLANLMEAIPGSAHTIVYHGAVPVLCNKLVMITDIDLAEQTLSTMEKISEEYPSAIVREGGLGALLNMLDFFPTGVQRIALHAAANCCRNLSSDSFDMVKQVLPVVRGALGSPDQRTVEYAALCVIRLIESYHRSAPEHLTALLDADFIRAISVLLSPANNAPLITATTYTQFLRALATAAKASAMTAIALLEADIVSILYQLLTGVLPPIDNDSSNEQGDAAGGQGLGGGLADMAVMENLAHRPKEQIEEALSLVSELMPPLPKDGIFDSRAYNEKAYMKMLKSKAKAGKTDRVATRSQAAAVIPESSEATEIPAEVAPLMELPSSAVVDPPTPEPAIASFGAGTFGKAEQVSRRFELLLSKPELTGRFIRLMIPVLIDVYAASVLINVRIRALTAIVKAVNFLDEDGLKNALKLVPVASFIGSILASTDTHTLVLSALQLVELLLIKEAATYRASFRREGVLHAIEGIADRKLTTSKSKDAEQSLNDLGQEESMPLAPSSSVKRSSTSSVDPQDAIILRGRVIRWKYLTSQAEVNEELILHDLRSFGASISNRRLSKTELNQSLNAIAHTLSGSADDISSFELKQSGLIETMLLFVSEKDYDVPLDYREKAFFNAFAGSPQGLSVLVKRLQELLTRSENFEVRTVSPGFDDNKHRSASMLARAIRLKLIGDDSADIPRSVSNITVSIQAIATFQALNDYLRPRLSGLLPTLGSSSSRLSAMLALADSKASALLGGLSSTKPDGSQNTSSSANEPGTSDNMPATQVARRRSQRISAKQSNDAGSSMMPTEPANESNESATLSSPDDLQSGEHLVEPDLETEVLDDDDDDDELPEQTVNVSMTDDGSKVEAKTPQGTRVATPNPLKEKAGPSTPSNRTSYATALKAKPTDWHLQFSIDDHQIPLDATIYGAFYQHELRKSTGGTIHPSSIWSGLYTVKFKKVEGPAPSSESKPVSSDVSNVDVASSATPSSLPENDLCSRILRLLRVIHKLNSDSLEDGLTGVKNGSLPPSAFVNNKLTAKLVRQLEETMIVASSCLPDWALDLPHHFPLLFPFATRYSFLQSTSFGYARLILKWQSQQERSTETSRRDDGFGYLGRLQRQKVRISRKHLLESALKVFELYGSSSSVLEVEYFEEVGTGLGPTLEFYSLVSKEFARRDLKLWRDSDSTFLGPYVYHPHGLFPAPDGSEDSTEGIRTKRIQLFQVVGQFIAKALLDSRIIDVSFNKLFLKKVRGEEVPLTIESLKIVDPALASSLIKVQSCTLHESISSVEELSLDFTVPGYDMELRPNGRNTPVTSVNVDEYIHETIDAIIGKGIAAQVQAFRQGFSKVFSISDMRMFSIDELAMLFGNGEEDWSPETLLEAIKADHGFTMDSQPIRDLVAIMSEFDKVSRRQFLQFITGSPKLPIGGFRGLSPALTVVRRPHEAPLTPDNYLPSVMTCVNYLKLPEYSSREVMQERMHQAVKEGIHSGFHLS